MPPTTKLLFAANILGLALFLGMAFLLPLYGESEARKRFDTLEQQSSVNSAMLPSRPRGGDTATWIAAPAIGGVRAAANVGIGLTLLNVSLFMASQLKKKKKA